MAPTFENSQTAKALKVQGGLRELADEYSREGGAGVAALLCELASLPLESLARLHDLIVEFKTAREAVSEPA